MLDIGNFLFLQNVQNGIMIKNYDDENCCNVDNYENHNNDYDEIVMMMTMTTYFIPKLDSMSRIDVAGSQVPQVNSG